jgi:hypothetical protein
MKFVTISTNIWEFLKVEIQLIFYFLEKDSQIFYIEILKKEKTPIDFAFFEKWVKAC